MEQRLEFDFGMHMIKIEIMDKHLMTYEELLDRLLKVHYDILDDGFVGMITAKQLFENTIERGEIHMYGGVYGDPDFRENEGDDDEVYTTHVMLSGSELDEFSINSFVDIEMDRYGRVTVDRNNKDITNIYSGEHVGLFSNAFGHNEVVERELMENDLYVVIAGRTDTKELVASKIKMIDEMKGEVDDY